MLSGDEETWIWGYAWFWVLDTTLINLLTTELNYRYMYRCRTCADARQLPPRTIFIIHQGLNRTWVKGCVSYYKRYAIKVRMLRGCNISILTPSATSLVSLRAPLPSSVIQNMSFLAPVTCGPFPYRVFIPKTDMFNRDLHFTTLNYVYKGHVIRDD